MNDREARPELVVMLTRDDRTVSNALELFRACATLGVNHWGFKDVGLEDFELRRLAGEMKASGRKVYCEIVSLTEPEALRAVALAAACGVDVVMGSLYSEAVHAAAAESGLAYFPFVGRVTGHPSVLAGEIDEIVTEAEELCRHGVQGIDLLSYRHEREPEALLRSLVAAASVPVICAGSISSFAQIDAVSDAGAWGFTIGSALFDQAFSNGSFVDNLRRVVMWLAEEDRQSPSLSR